MGSVRFIIYLISVLLLSACIVVPIPTNQNKVIAGIPKTNEQLSFLKPGISTKQDVIEQLGTPNIYSYYKDGQLLAYTWDKRKLLLFYAYAAPYAGDIGLKDIPEHYLLIFQLDEQDVVLRFELVTRPLMKPLYIFLEEWRDTSISK